MPLLIRLKKSYMPILILMPSKLVCVLPVRRISPDLYNISFRIFSHNGCQKDNDTVLFQTKVAKRNCI